MFKNSTIFIVIIISIAFTTAVNAQHRRAHRQKDRVNHATIVCDERGCSNDVNAT